MTPDDNSDVGAGGDPARTTLPRQKAAMLGRCASFHSRSKAAEFWTMRDLALFNALYPQLGLTVLNLNDEPGGLVVFLPTPEGAEAIARWSSQGTIDLPPENSGKWE